MIIARLETSHFSFLALGETEAQAKRAMENTWNIHRHQTGADWAWEDVEEDVDYILLYSGQGCRDGLVVS